MKTVKQRLYLLFTPTIKIFTQPLDNVSKCPNAIKCPKGVCGTCSKSKQETLSNFEQSYFTF